MGALQKITTEQEYKAALNELSQLFNNPPPANTEQDKRFTLLCRLVHTYETEHFTIAPPSSEEAQRFRQEQERSTE